mgnify:CR=1 FL=1
MALRCEGQTLKKNILAEAISSALFFSPRHDVGVEHNVMTGSGTPVQAGLSPAAAHLKAAASAADPSTSGWGGLAAYLARMLTYL